MAGISVKATAWFTITALRSVSTQSLRKATLTVSLMVQLSKIHVPWIIHSFGAKLESIAKLETSELLRCSVQKLTNWSSMLNNTLFQIHISQLWHFSIFVWIGRGVSNVVDVRIWRYCTFSKYLSVWGRDVPNDDHKTKHWFPLVPKKDMRISLSTTVPRISDIVWWNNHKCLT